MRLPVRLACAAAVAAALSACTRPRTELILGMATDLVAPGNLDEVTLTVQRDGTPVVARDFRISGQPGVPDELPGSYGLFTDDGSDPRIQIDLVGMLKGNTLVRRTSVLNLVSGKTLFLRMALLQKCIGVTCGANQTCVDGTCASVDVDAATLPEFQNDAVTTTGCQSGSTLIDTGTGKPLPTSGSGQCGAHEQCSESTCYTIPPTADASVAPDLAQPDLAMPDLAPAPDFAPATDLAPESDLVPEPDLTSPPDLTQPYGITAIVPPTVPSQGNGTPIDIQGAQFQSGATVMINGVAAMVTNVTPMDIQAIAPAQPGVHGPVAVTVKDPGGATVTRSDLLAYTLTPSFASSTTIGAAPLAGIQSVARGDWNGDGNLDLAITDGVNVDLLLGAGDGTFTAGNTLSGLACPVSVNAGDLDGNGTLDLVVTNVCSPNANDVAIFSGDGAGGFSRVASLAAGTMIGNDYPSASAITDLDGDGKLDVAIANENDNTVLLFSNAGAWSFTPGTPIAVGKAPRFILPVDLTGDGHAELVTTDFKGNDLSILSWTGSGLSYVVAHTITTANAPWFVTAADFNGDGKKDLAWSDAGGEATVTPFIGGAINVVLGNGTTAPTGLSAFQAGVLPAHVIALDVDGDGKQDLVACDYSSDAVSVLLGVGDGTFQPARSFDAGSRPIALTAADFDKDGKVDLVVAGLNGSQPSLYFLKGAGAGAFPIPAAPVGKGIAGMAAADVDGDGTLDLVASDPADQQVCVYFGGPASTLAPYCGSPPTTQAATVVAVGDVVGTSDLDIVVGSATGLYYLENLGMRNLNDPVALAGTVDAQGLALADLNGDKLVDIVVADTAMNGDLAVVLNQGNSLFAAPTYVPIPLSSPKDVALLDLNGDGKLDAVIDDTLKAQVYVLLGDGKGGFGAPATFATGTIAPAGSVGMVTGDFNEDGKPDVAVSDGTPMLAMLPGDGRGGLGAAIITPFAQAPTQLAAADFDLDGHLDVAAAEPSGQTYEVLYGRGNGSFTPHSFTGCPQPFTLVAGDYNKDTLPDLVISGSEGNSASLFLNTSQ